MRIIKEPTDEDYRTPTYRKEYAHYILNNLNTIEKKQMLTVYWDISIGQFRVDGIWPWDEEISSIDLETKVNSDFTEDMLRNKIDVLFKNKGHKLEGHRDGEYIYFDYTPSKGGGGKFKTSIDFSLLTGKKLRIKIWGEPLYALERMLEFSDASGLKTRPFSKTPRPVKIEQNSQEYATSVVH